MADNNSGWGDDDFLDGDIDFDFDFDNDTSDKGFLRSLASGILSGVKDNTVGSTDAQIKTLRRVLPGSYGTFFNSADILAAKTRQAVKEFKENSADMMEDLSYLSGNLAEKLRDRLPNKITDGLDTFSQKDFSSWKGASADDGDKLNSMEEVSDDELASVVQSQMEQHSQLQVETSVMLASSFNNGMAKNITAALEGNKSLLNIDTSLRQIYEYQTKVQARNDAIKINLMTRMHLTNVKYYRFMESAMHRQVRELKDIVKYSQMSDYQKLTTLDAAKKQLRESIFSTTIGKFGGMKGALTDIFNKDKVNDALAAGTQIASDVRMGVDMLDAMGGGGNMTEAVGKFIGGLLVERGPNFFKHGKGKAIIEKVRKNYPEAAKQFDKLYADIESFGDVASYISVAGIGNATQHVKKSGRFEKDEETYEGYLASLPSGARKMSKMEFNAMKKGMNLAGGLLNFGADTMTDPSGAIYTLKQQNLKTLTDVAPWTKLQSRTITEVIPRMLSVLIASNESIRVAVGGGDVDRLTYDFRNSRLIKDKRAQKEAMRSVLGKNEFSGYASNINSITDQIVGEGKLSKKARTALGMTMADLGGKDVDFNPYDYIDMETSKYVDAETAKELGEFMKKRFGITDNDLDIVSGNTLGAFAHRNIMPTKEGKKLVHELANRTKSSRAFLPDISEMIDLQIALGNEEGLRKAGLIQGFGSDRRISDERIMDEIYGHLSGDGVDDIGFEDEGEGKKGKSKRSILNRLFGNKRSKGSPKEDTSDDSRNDESLNRLVMALENSTKQFEKMALNAGVQIDMSKTEGLLSENNILLSAIKEINSEQLVQLTNLVKRTPVTDNLKDDELSEDEKKQRKEKKGLMERIKSIAPRNLFNKGMETILSNQPLVLGGLLGGLAVTAFNDPRAAMLLGGGALAMGVYGKLGDIAKNHGSEPSDDEDIFDSPDNPEPILRSSKLKNGDYYDAVTGKLISSWSSIKNGVKLLGGQIVATAKELGGKLFGPDGRKVVLKGLNWVKDTAVKVFKYLDPVGSFKKVGNKVGRYFYQMDVYRAGDKEPTLYRSGFQRGEYYVEKDDDLVAIKGWNEIEGPVYDQMMNVLLSQDDIDNGLVTSAGVKINTLMKGASVMGEGLLRGMKLLKDKTLKGGKKAADAIKETVKNDYTPITDRLDLIYGILCKKFGYEPEKILAGRPGGGGDVGNAILDTIEQVSPETAPKGDATRAGSLAEKARIKREEKREKVEDSIIGINDALNGKGDGEKDKDKKQGLFGKLLGFLKNPLKGIGSLFGKGALGLIGAYFTMMVKGVPLMFKSVGLIAKGVWRLGGLLTSLVKNLFGWGGASDDIYIDENGKRQRRKDGNRGNNRGNRGGGPRPRPRPSRMAGFGKFARGGAIAMGSQMAFAAGREMFDVEEGSAADTALTVGEYAAQGYGYYTMAAGAASMMGVSLPGAAAIGGALTTGATAVGSAAMSGLTMAAPLLFNPITLGVLAVGAIGYGVWSYYNRGKGSQYPLRIAQYGFEDDSSDIAARIRKLEDDLKDYVMFQGGSAAFSKNTPLEQLFQSFLTNPSNPKETSELYAWFNYRFKPTYLIYMGALKQSGFTSLEEYDESTEPRVYQTAKQVHQALLGWVPCPYEVTARIDNEIPTLDKVKTLKLIEEHFKDMQKYNERHGLNSEGKVEVEETRVKTVEEQVKESEEAGFWKSGWMWVTGEYVDQKDIDEINQKFPIDKALKETDISDMMPGGDKPMDTLTAIRLAGYGNSGNVPYRVEAVLRLERYMESQVNMIGDDIRLVGKSGEIYNLFKTSFRITNDKEGNNWLLWFRDRFLPIYLIWHREIYLNRRDVPSKAWKTISKTTRFNIANRFLEAKGTANGKLVSIWGINRYSPFPGTFIFKGISDKVKDWVKVLEFESTEAKLKDPKAEAARTDAKEVVNLHEVTNRKGESVGANRQKTADVLGNAFSKLPGSDKARLNHYAADPVSFYGGAAEYKAIQYDANQKIDNSGIKSNGQDKGISIPRETAIKYIIREMTKAGYTDPRQIAEMLALTHYETGGYTRTAENMNYTDPARAKSIFSRLSGMSTDEVRRLINQGPQAFANKVYGGWLGNQGPNDGWLYRGRGLVQLTGLANYAKAAKDLGIDIVNNPQWVSEDPEVMAKTAVWYFKNNEQLQSISQHGDFHYSARGLNGGKALPGIGQRYDLYKDYLSKVIAGKYTSDEPEGSPTTGAEGSPTGATADPTTGNGEQPKQTDVQRITAPKLFAPPAGLETNAGDGDDYDGFPGMKPPSTFNPNMSNGAANEFVKTTTTMDVASGKRSSDYGNLKLKSAETVEGGPSHPGIIRLAEEIQRRVPNFRYFSALNDGYHQNLPSNSAHKRGMALDFTVTNGVTGSDEATRITVQILESAGLNSKDDFLVINEYRRKTKYGNGGHVHANFRTDNAADKFAKAMGPGVERQGGMAEALNQQQVDPQGQAQPAVQNLPAPSPDDSLSTGIKAIAQNRQATEAPPETAAREEPMQANRQTQGNLGTTEDPANPNGNAPIANVIGKGRTPPTESTVNVQALKPETETAINAQAQMMAQMVQQLVILNKTMGKSVSEPTPHVKV